MLEGKHLRFRFFDDTFYLFSNKESFCSWMGRIISSFGQLWKWKRCSARPPFDIFLFIFGMFLERKIYWSIPHTFSNLAQSFPADWIKNIRKIWFENSKKNPKPVCYHEECSNCAPSKNRIKLFGTRSAPTYRIFVYQSYYISNQFIVYFVFHISI